MYGEGGVGYVYLCYGLHLLFNVITNAKDIPHAVLIRAIQPADGIDCMVKRRKMAKANSKLITGPGTVSQALGITIQHTGLPLFGPPIWIEDRDIQVPSHKIITGPRVGVDYAGEDASLPWRFRLL